MIEIQQQKKYNTKNTNDRFTKTQIKKNTKITVTGIKKY